MGAPIGARRVLADQRFYEQRVLAEHATAFDMAQAALVVPGPLADENGVAFAEGQTVETLTELWRTTGSAMSMIIASTRGVLTRINDTNAMVLFEGNDAPYWIRRDRMKVVLKVVAA